VLAALVTQPAQVAAGASGSGGGGDAAGGSGSGEGTVGYLSSPQLFGLQLRDATFRRDLLVQVGVGRCRGWSRHVLRLERSVTGFQC
jgi:hypothetical protein